MVCLVTLWVAKPQHGVDETTVALAGAVLLLFRPFCDRKPKDVFRFVDVELVMFMAATLMLSVALIDTGADQWLSEMVLASVPAGMVENSTAVIVFLSLVAVSSHLAITSRPARAAILIPALDLPVSGMGLDATLAVLIAMVGTGFCQSMMVSAKPVAIFGLHETAGFTQNDLTRLAVPLAPVMVFLLDVFALWVWPSQLSLNAKEEAGRTSQRLHQEGWRTRALLTTAQHEALTSMTAIWPVGAPEKSPRPSPRPVEFSGTKNLGSKAIRSTSGQQRTNSLPSQIRRDMKRAEADFQRAGRQIQRDLSRLLR